MHTAIERFAGVDARDRKDVAVELATAFKIDNPKFGKDGKKHSEHIAAWDWTLAPHKSYSVTALVGGDRGLIEDHKKAVRTALDAGEKYTQARLRNIAPMTTANWC